VPHFYSVIIGTELLNGRRVDKHFAFLNHELLQRGWELKGNFVIADTPELIINTYKLIQQDPSSVMFSFGGIGSTPDDLTRECAAKAFREGHMSVHEQAKERIVMQFGDEAYPHRIHMANLPIDADLLDNVINNVPGFSLDDRFFFTPGFPEMAHPMIVEALDKYYPKNRAKYHDTFIINGSENDVLDIMLQLPKELEFSSLPRFVGEKRVVEIYMSSYDNTLVSYWSHYFKEEVHHKGLTLKE
jgi:molybdopterin-biosynthesis enzyme MoeA-like protein